MSSVNDSSSDAPNTTPAITRPQNRASQTSQAQRVKPANFQTDDASRQSSERNSNTIKGRSTSRSKQSNAPAGKKVAKYFILDTNVLLHDPACLGRFKDNHICITTDVLAELDKFKSEQTERGANARRVHRMLMELFAQPGSVTEGVATAGGGTVRVVVFDPATSEKNNEQMAAFFRIFPDRERVDHRILASAVLLMKDNPAPIILVTKDLNMHLKARAVGIDCQDYLNDKVHPEEIANFDFKSIVLEPLEWQRFASSGELLLQPDRHIPLALNEYVMLQSGEQLLPCLLYTSPSPRDRG